ncbi:TlpA disulfide reductase family protein [Flavobacterium sp. 5]|uniref:TlpA disulfide reductase family protein n=1 Tax=Flavobacterium sp. 5 TaxID=2035199 RepID=UPI000C2C34E6|nr:TlpA disulfide reductase family protein [Flavobacterium sp. 5]PKB17658.1 peroxiredoxin [Flavobacterium sp. 5]
MTLNYLKIFFNLLIIISFASCNKLKPNTFVLNGTIKGDYSGFIYLNYNSHEDSCLVSNNKFRFEGTIFSTTGASLSTKRRTSAMEKDFYLEKSEITINIEVQQKKIGETQLDWIIINSSKGSKIADLQNEFESYKTKFKDNKDWEFKKYLKINEIITKNPKSKYSASLLAEESWNSKSDISKLQKMYKKLDLEFQDSSTINVLKSNLFPEEISLVGKPIIDFELPNENGKQLQTKKYRGKILFIDFWASWCAPCRKQMPEIKRIYSQFKKYDFKILAISLDSEKDKQKWQNAIIKENSTWDNVIETGQFDGKVTQMYNIQSIPSNFLIDEKGTIIDQNISPEQLEEHLHKYFKTVK